MPWKITIKGTVWTVQADKDAVAKLERLARELPVGLYMEKITPQPKE